MGLIKEPKNIDLTIKSEPWTEDELIQFRAIMKKQRDRKLKLRVIKKVVKKTQKSGKVQLP
jgi:hypothetical protein